MHVHDRKNNMKDHELKDKAPNADTSFSRSLFTIENHLVAIYSTTYHMSLPVMLLPLTLFCSVSNIISRLLEHHSTFPLTFQLPKVSGF